ncbi:MAG: DUF2254 domain-containing protein [Candidatus Levyibacteriota bacterium]
MPIPGPDIDRSQGSSATTMARARARWLRTEKYIKNKLLWGQLYRATSYARSALWIIPLFSILLVLVFAPILRALDRWLRWNVLGLPPSGVQALYQTVITLTISFLVFTFGSLLVAIQVAGGQLTPRIIATTLLRDNVVRFSVGLFVFTLMFAVTALNRLELSVPELAAFVTVVLGIGCMATFLFLIDYTARLLRPVSILRRVGNEGLSVIEAVYPDPASDAADVGSGAGARLGSPSRVVAHLGDSGIVLAVDMESLVHEASRFDGVVELVPQVGDFVAEDAPLFALYGGAARIDDRKLRAAVALGAERTMEQDPIFGFRILVDIALKALSPAINDPTTAVCAIDQVHRLLRVVGKRRLRGDVITDEGGRTRVVYRTPNWEDFVHVACNEIRSCGANNVQVARRLRAMLDNLVASLPEHRRQALVEERSRLDQVIETSYSLSEDRALARIPDPQGLGGSTGAWKPS